MKYLHIREEELKNKVAQDYFWIYDHTKIIGNIDFCVCIHQHKKELLETESLLWAEAKKGKSDIYKSLVQLILTIGKARTFDKYLPPAFLGAFDAEKIAFIPYSLITDVFYQNDFNWTITPSNYDTKEFKLLLHTVTHTIDSNSLLFYFGKDDKELHLFIKHNFVVGKLGITKTQIDKNNFMVIYNKWVVAVKPSIAVDWDIAKKHGIIDGDFYLADLLSQENNTLKEKLFVLLNNDHYELDRKIDEMGMFSSKKTEFNDHQKAHTLFWNKYHRPPKEEYWDYIVERRDLLVPQDIRERKGSFYTPQIWVELSQKYIADVLGENWQDEYFVWDCAAGTGNLLAGLINKYHIYASTLDTQDVNAMHDRIDNGANLLKEHVFQFDFLNDDFSKLPQSLQNIINDTEKRKKLLIYINPPYAEAGNARTMTGLGEHKPKTTIDNNIYFKYRSILGKASNELFTQFLIRIYKEIPTCKIANFSKLKNLQSSNFSDFRETFRASLEKIFLVPADTFDNVKGQFPIGFFVWDTQKNEKFEEIKADVFNENQNLFRTKKLLSCDGNKLINQWIKSYQHIEQKLSIGEIGVARNDMQNKKLCWIAHKADRGLIISQNTLIYDTIFFSVQASIEATWLNDRDQFLYPNKKWEKDTEFQNDCLAYTLFHGQNRISSKEGVNYWIPFTEREVNAREKFESNFMTQFIAGKLKAEPHSDLYHEKEIRTTPLVFSAEAQAVFNAGKSLWTYYHQQPNINVNASLYDIREYFQGRNDKGKMNAKSTDATYTHLIADLRSNLKLLALKLQPKVYEYGFLKG